MEGPSGVAQPWGVEDGEWLESLQEEEMEAVGWLWGKVEAQGGASQAKEVLFCLVFRGAEETDENVCSSLCGCGGGGGRNRAPFLCGCPSPISRL